MNKVRRKQVKEASELISKALEILEEVFDGEQEAYDNLPDNIRESEKGEQMSDGIDAIEDVISSLRDASCLDDL